MATLWVEWLTEESARQLHRRPTLQVYAGYDIHVVRGARSRSLVRDIGLGDTTGHLFPAVVVPGGPAVPSDVVSVQFVPQFNAQQTSTTKISGHGVEVDRNTGEVTALTNPPTPRLHNFLVDVHVTVREATSGATKALTPISVRVHIHASVNAVWLTPSTLTIPTDSDGQRLTVLAHFNTDPPAPAHVNDSLVGDISRIPGLTWTPIGTATSDVAVGAAGAITVRKEVSQTVEVALPADWGGATATATVQGAKAWGDRSFEERAALLIAGPGADRLDEVPNVLFVPDGFASSDESAFNQIVQHFVSELRTVRSTTPFNLFLNNDSINFWSVFFPSRERGASTLYYVRPLLPKPYRSPRKWMPPEVAPTTAVWTLNNVFRRAGIPIPLDWIEVPPSIDDASRAAQISRWQTLYSATRIPTGAVTYSLYEEWRLWSRRTLLDEQDTALGLAVGRRPYADHKSEPRVIDFHPYRTKRSDVDKLLTKLTDGVGGQEIGATWKSTEPDMGKDKALVIALAAGARRGGAFVGGSTVTAALVNDQRTSSEHIAGTARRRITPYEPPHSIWNQIRMPRSAHGTVVHELSHALGLADEYTNYAASLPSHHVRWLVAKGNVQPESELQTSPGSSTLDGSKLRWRWPRIAKAGVLADAPGDMGGGEFVIPLRAGHKLLFDEGDEVFLRQRPLLQPADPSTPTQMKPAKVSVKLRVLGRQLLEQIAVKVISGTLDPSDFPGPQLPGRPPPGRPPSIVFAPTPAPPNARNRGDTIAELVPRHVREHITSSGMPLNRRTGACKLDHPDILPVLNPPPVVSFEAPRRLELAVSTGESERQFQRRHREPDLSRTRL